MRQKTFLATVGVLPLLFGLSAAATAEDLSDFDWSAGSRAVDAIFADLAMDNAPGCSTAMRVTRRAM